MAKELRLATSLKYAKGNLGGAWSQNVTVNISGNEYADQLQTIGETTSVPIEFASIVTVGYYQITNTDATNSIDISYDAGVTFPIRLQPTQTMLVPNNATAAPVPVVHAKANTAPAVVTVRAISA